MANSLKLTEEEKAQLVLSLLLVLAIVEVALSLHPNQKTLKGNKRRRQTAT